MVHTTILHVRSPDALGTARLARNSRKSEGRMAMGTGTVPIKHSPGPFHVRVVDRGPGCAAARVSSEFSSSKPVFCVVAGGKCCVAVAAEEWPSVQRFLLGVAAASTAPLCDHVL